MTKHPKLFPGHQHQWADDLPGTMVRCTVCDFRAPRNVARPDGRMIQPEQQVTEGETT